MATGRVPIESRLKRKAWVRQGLLQKTHTSFFSPYTGNTKDSIVFQSKNSSATDGHTVDFDFSGNLAGKPIKGRNTATGKGEEKKKFSDSITVERYRLVVDNGDKFDGVDIGDLSINEHKDSRSKLADLYMRVKDQNLFDICQGLAGQEPTHNIDLGSEFGTDTLIDIENVLKTSRGFSVGGIRRPLNAYKTKDGKPIWLFVVDASMAAKLRKSEGYKNLIYNADVRGKQNLAFKSVFGKIGDIILAEAPSFFGQTSGTGVIHFEDTGTEISGVRQKDTNGVWAGQEGFNYETGLMKSRGFILGAGALMLAYGKQPEYHYQKSTDFGITTESAVEYWMNARKVKLQTEGHTDYAQAKVAAIDYGIVSVDVNIN